jgi:hypothetical protein
LRGGEFALRDVRHHANDGGVLTLSVSGAFVSKTNSRPDPVARMQVCAHEPLINDYDVASRPAVIARECASADYRNLQESEILGVTLTAVTDVTLAPGSFGTPSISTERTSPPLSGKSQAA